MTSTVTSGGHCSESPVPVRWPFLSNHDVILRIIALDGHHEWLLFFKKELPRLLDDAVLNYLGQFLVR